MKRAAVGIHLPRMCSGLWDCVALVAGAIAIYVASQSLFPRKPPQEEYVRQYSPEDYDDEDDY